MADNPSTEDPLAAGWPPHALHAAIHRLAEENYSQRAIAAHLGISRYRVTEAIATDDPDHWLRGRQRPVTAPVEEHVLTWLRARVAKPRREREPLRALRPWLTREHGITLSESTMYKLVNRLCSQDPTLNPDQNTEIMTFVEQHFHGRQRENPGSDDGSTGHKE